MTLPTGWTAKNVLGLLFCGVLVPGILIWQVGTGENPDRALGFFWGGLTVGGFSRGLYEVARARGSFRTLVFDEKMSQHNWWLVPLSILVVTLMWVANEGEPWRWVLLFVPLAWVAASLRAPRKGRSLTVSDAV